MLSETEALARAWAGAGDRAVTAQGRLWVSPGRTGAGFRRAPIGIEPRYIDVLFDLDRSGTAGIRLILQLAGWVVISRLMRNDFEEKQTRRRSELIVHSVSKKDR
jgi:hypothetical protein